MKTYTGKKGGSITIRCEFSNYGEKRFLCKDTCEGMNILIETSKDTYQKGRFNIQYERRNIFSSDFLHVKITELKTSDSGWYRCRSDTWKGIQYDDFCLVVTEGEFYGFKHLGQTFNRSILINQHIETVTNDETHHHNN